MWHYPNINESITVVIMEEHTFAFLSASAFLFVCLFVLRMFSWIRNFSKNNVNQYSGKVRIIILPLQH